MSSVLEKIDLSGDRRIRQQAFAALTEEFAGTETRENLEIMNQMRLVEVAARHRNIRPIRRGIASRQVNGPLKTLNATEQLRRNTDLLGKYLDEMPLTQTEVRGKISNPRFARLPPKDVQSGPNCPMFFR